MLLGNFLFNTSRILYSLEIALYASSCLGNLNKYLPSTFIAKFVQPEPSPSKLPFFNSGYFFNIS